jgi:very-short-patch-repair endonuclease
MLAASLGADGPTSHRSASWLWGLIDAPDQVDVSIRYPRRATLWPPACAHRIRDLSDIHVLRRGGIPLTTPMRTIVDLGLVEPWWVVDRALGQAISSKLLPLRAVVLLREELARRGRNGTGVVQRVFDERLLRGADEGSQLELRLLRIVRRFGLPPITFQHEVWHEGRFVARPDAAYPDRMVAIEADGFEWHSTPEAFQHDRARQNDLVVLGWTILRFTHHDIVRRQAHVAEVIHSVL